MKLNDIVKMESADHVILQIKASDLMAFAKVLIEETSVPEFLNTKETMDYLNIGRTTLYEWSKKGILKPIKRGKKVLYRRTDVVTLENFNTENYGY